MPLFILGVCLVFGKQQITGAGHLFCIPISAGHVFLKGPEYITQSVPSDCQQSPKMHTNLVNSFGILTEIFILVDKSNSKHFNFVFF